LATLIISTLCVSAPTRAQPEEPPNKGILRVAVYDAAPYGAVGPDGSFKGASVDLWRRAAEAMNIHYELTLVGQMDAALSGLEQGRYDAAVGAITITPERAARVEFSYPAHRSGVAVAIRKETGPMAALAAYARAAAELGALIVATAALLLLIGVAMWLIEKPNRAAAQTAESSVVTLRDGVYWAVVTMTTVGYGDKTPKTPVGRFVAILWMLGSVALVSLLSANLVSRLTAEQVEGGGAFTQNDLIGKRLAAAASSSGAEYLDGQRLSYAKFDNLHDALASVAAGESDIAVNSVGALRHMVAARFAGVLRVPPTLLAPAYMAIALPIGSPLKKPLDRALMKITATPEWRAVEETYFSR